MTGQGREIGDLLKRRAVSIAQVEETKWAGNSARDPGDGYKISYKEGTSRQNRVGIILNAEFKAKVI